MNAIHLQTEHLTNPLGLETRTPRFFWNCEGGLRQSAYRIVVTGEEGVLWDSGKVPSSSMSYIVYGGKPLKCRTRAEWSVTLWDETDTPGDAASAWFETGLAQEDWSADWISGDCRPKKNVRQGADCFRKEFTLEGPVRRARLYLTACGLYEAALNGVRVGEFVLAPGFTDYRRRIQYQTYDVTDLLREENVLDVLLGDGWFRGSLGAFGQTNVYGRRTALRAQLEISYEDGHLARICSDGSFRWSNDGPVTFQDLQDGERVDFRKSPSFSGRARVVSESRRLTGTANVPVTRHEVFTPTLLTTPSGHRVLDFHQNLAGFLRVNLQGRPGQVLHLLLGETLTPEGEFTQENFQETKPAREWGTMTSLKLCMGQTDKLKGETQPTPKQEITLLCSGGEDCYETKFAIFGFRYALVDWEGDLDPEAFAAVAVYSDLEPAGDFTCSNDLVNRLVSNTRWSMKSNFADIPTDCPTRERLGWTGDAQIFFHTAAYFMDVSAFYGKFLQDMAEGVLKSGKLPSVVPYSGMSMIYDNTGMSVGWGDAQVLIPYRFWKRYGDRRVLETFYPMMSGYADYMIAHTGHKDKKAAKADPNNRYVYEKGVHLGEWLEPEEFQDAAPGGRTLHPEECTAYLSWTMTMMTETAEELGKPEDADKYRDYAQGARRAYHDLFLRDGAPDTDRQAKLVRPLALGLVEEDALRRDLEARLVQAVRNRHHQVSTGFLSTPFVLPVLTQAGHAEDAYRMLENETPPGWLYEVKSGATTIWETWEGANGKHGSDGSLNHYSPGAVCQWLFDTAAGIQVTGENHFTIAPVPGGTLTYARAFHRSLYGRVESSWERRGEQTVFHVAVPPNTTAELILPDGTRQTLSPGRFTFSCAKGVQSGGL